LLGATREYAEARCRFACGALSAGTPMFLFGEEVGAERRRWQDSDVYLVVGSLNDRVFEGYIISDWRVGGP